MPFGEINESSHQKKAEVVRRIRRKARIVPTQHPSKKSLERRRRLEPHLHKWLRYYMPDTFPDRWGTEHRQCCTTLQQCIEEGGSFALAMPRGSGKSSIGKGACVYAPLTGKRSYIVPIGASDALANEYLEFIKSQLDGTNERIAEDYSEAVGFFKALDGSALKARHQLREDEKRTGISWRAKGITFPTVLDPKGNQYPFSGARIECRGITAAMKGMAKHVGGKIFRPDFVLPDDVQTEDDALSQIACSKIENKIIGTVLALAGPRRRIACFMPCTCVERNDVSDRFLDRQKHPEFQGTKCPMFVKWPDAQDTLWKEYADIRRSAENDAEGKRLATKFYKQNRKAMDAGAVVSWPDRIRDGETSAIETAENLLIELGESKFFAEMQQDPKDIAESAYELTAQTIIAHTIDTPRLIVPPAVTVIGGHADINRAGIHWALASFDQQMSPHVFDYGKTPSRGDLWQENASEHVRQSAIFAGLKATCDAIAEREYTRDGVRTGPGLVLIDASYESTTVHRFAEQARYPFRVAPAIGRAAQKYRYSAATLVGRPGEYCHMQRPANKRAPYAMFCACYWREVMQRAFLSDPGAPGGCTLYHQPDPRRHMPFAEHVVAEKMRGKYKTDMGWRWEWHAAPGAVWDWGDALTGCWVAAALQGLTTAGGQAPRPTRKPKQKRRIRHVEI